jgi:glycosyltransferase involved in cell wall biosynthesis
MPKRLVIDARWLHSGIGRYVMNLLEGLKYRNGFTVHALVQARDTNTLRPLCDTLTVVDPPIYGIREQLSVPWAARGADLLHVPQYNVPVIFPGDFMVTIHDLIHLMAPPFSRFLASKAYAWPLLRFATRNAQRIVTVSHFSKSQLVQRLGVPEEKITVIYNGVHPRFRELDHEEALERARRTLSLSSRFLLCVGNLKPHKNIDLLLRAVSLLRARNVGNHQLVIVGEGCRQREYLEAMCTRLGMLPHVRFIPHVDEEDLPCLYAAADLFVMPSLMEGFGYPVVEAMACGTPVVCSRAAALPEIAGDAAQFFDPTSCEDLAVAVEKVLESPDLRGLLRCRGLDRARVFGWEECGRNHAELYKTLMEV